MPPISTIAAAALLSTLLLSGCVGGNQYQGGNYGPTQQDASKNGEMNGLSNEGGRNEGAGGGGRR